MRSPQTTPQCRQAIYKLAAKICNIISPPLARWLTAHVSKWQRLKECLPWETYRTISKSLNFSDCRRVRVLPWQPNKFMALTINQALLDQGKCLLSSLPPAIQGEHGRHKLWAATMTLKETGITAHDAAKLLMEHFNPRCIPTWSEAEITRTVNRAFQTSATIISNPRWSPLDSEARLKVVQETNVKMDEFAQWSPSPLESPDPQFFLDGLYGEGDPLLCLGWEKNRSTTESRNWWRGKLDGIQLVVPNAMKARLGKPVGFDYMSPRTLANTGARLYLVVEFDLVEKNANGEDTRDAEFIRRMAENGFSVRDINASLIAHLSSKAPLVMAVSSGGKSLHGWFRTKDVPEPVVEGFFDYASSLGADKSLWSPCHLVRLPDGVRDNGRIQSVKYFNPNLICNE